MNFGSMTAPDTSSPIALTPADGLPDKRTRNLLSFVGFFIIKNVGIHRSTYSVVEGGSLLYEKLILRLNTALNLWPNVIQLNFV